MNRMSWGVMSGLLVLCLAVTGCKIKPTADFTADVRSGSAPLTVQFTDNSGAGSSSITSWHWLLGDGSESTAQNPSLMYAMPGTYNVSLEVASPAGSSTALKLNYIHVTPPATGTIRTVLLPGDVPLAMAWIPAGTFTMGSPDTEPDRIANEGPQHEVGLAGFWMAKYELTKGQWQAVMGTTPWSSGAHVLADPNSPAVWVSWDDAQSFIAALNSLTGQTFRLPSEAEWEYACRAAVTARFYWGGDPAFLAMDNYAWWWGNTSPAGEEYAHVVGGKLPNAWGLCDMSGNAREWCGDDWHADYAGAPTEGQTWVDAPRSEYRVLRGGSWGDGRGGCRSAYRSYGSPWSADSIYGFRLAM